MSSKTTNYNLHKIDLTDAPPDITVLNPNWDTLDAKIKALEDAGWTRAEIVEVINDTVSATDISGKVSKTGDELTGALDFKNNTEFRAISKTRLINNITYYVNWGCGQLGGEGIVAMELHLPSTTGGDSSVLGRLEIGSRGVSFLDANNKRTYLYSSGLTAAAIEN